MCCGWCGIIGVVGWCDVVRLVCCGWCDVVGVVYRSLMYIIGCYCILTGYISLYCIVLNHIVRLKTQIQIGKEE